MILALLAAWAAASEGAAPLRAASDWYAQPSLLSPGVLYNYTHYPGQNAYSERGGVELDNNTNAPIHLSIFECLDHCQLKPHCDCAVFKPVNGECWAYEECHPKAFAYDPLFDVYVRHRAVTTRPPSTTTSTTTTTTATSTTTTTTESASKVIERIADDVTLATIAVVMLAGMAIYVKVGRIAAVSQLSKTGMLLTLGIFHCVGQFIPWVAFCVDGVDCQRGMDWTVHLFYAVLLALASPFLGGIYISSVARDKLPLLGRRGLPFLLFSYCTTVMNGIDTYSDSLITAKAMDCEHEVSGLEVLSTALLANFWGGMALQVLTLGLMGRFAENGSCWRGFKWALLTLADVLPHPHARVRSASVTLSPATPSMSNSLADLEKPLSSPASLDGPEDPRSLKAVGVPEQGLDSSPGAIFSLGVDGDAKVFAQTLILVRLVTEDLPQPILQFLLGERVGFGYDVCLSMVSGILLSMYGIFELITEGHGEAVSDASGGSSDESSEDESSDSEETEDTENNAGSNSASFS